jgi:hypothetical protein
MMTKDKETFDVQKNVGKTKKGSSRCFREWKKSSNYKKALKNNLLDNGPWLSNNKVLYKVLK